MPDDIQYWLAIDRLQKIGPVKFKKLYNYFPTMKGAWRADSSEWEKAGIDKNSVSSFVIEKNQINPQQLLDEISQEQIKIITILDKDYPAILKELYSPPAIIYYKGTLPSSDDICLGVVGARKISQYGRQVTSEIVADLARNKISIVSGLAAGVDSLAHQTTLDNKGKTVAVLGGGIDKNSIYPSQNRYLAEKIIDSGGAIISEYKPKTLPMKLNFPARNRIISGLSLGTLIIEASEESGALITARFALEQNREVFAVPGSIYSPTSKGTNGLLKQGAKLVTCANDILETLNLDQLQSVISSKKISPDTKEEEILLGFLSKEPTHIDSLVKQSGLATNTVSATLIMMEMKGKIKNLGGMNYVLAR
ncbi:MAG: DNA-processing protein DprA [bacterium]